MHEWALAESVAASIRNEMERHKGSLLHAVHLKFGELQNIDRGIFEDGLSTMIEDIPRDGGVVHIEVEHAQLQCNACGRRWGLETAEDLTENEREAIHFLPEAAHAFLHCPSCGSQDCQITEGRGISLTAIELTEPDNVDGA